MYSVSSSLTLRLHLERLRFPQPNLLKLCLVITVEIRQILVHTPAEFQDTRSETLHYFLFRTLLTIVWQSCSVTSHRYRPLQDRLQQFWQYPLLI
jgi:hypothetical protein